ncbi:MAG: hypothetical protein ACAH80_16610 [Alphaproteobacteria bacterium]
MAKKPSTDFNATKLASQLKKLDDEKFFDRMMREYPLDADTKRMEVAIKVMAKRFPKLSKADQLTWALDTAVENNNTQMIDFLLTKGAKIDGTASAYMPGLLGNARYTPVATAIQSGTAETLKHLFNKGAAPDPKDNSFLFNAAYMRRSLEKTRILLDAGTKSGAGRAVYGVLRVHRKTEIAREILERTGFDVNTNNGELVRSAVLGVQRGDEGPDGPVISLLRSKGADFEAVAKRLEKEEALCGITDSATAKLARSLAAPKL